MSVVFCANCSKGVPGKDGGVWVITSLSEMPLMPFFCSSSCCDEFRDRIAKMSDKDIKSRYESWAWEYLLPFAAAHRQK